MLIFNQKLAQDLEDIKIESRQIVVISFDDDNSDLLYLYSHSDNTPAAYQDIEVGGDKDISSATGLVDDSTVFTVDVELNGGSSSSVEVVGEDCQTYEELINELNSVIASSPMTWPNGGTFSLVGGNLRLTSGKRGTGSEVSVVDVDLLSNLDGFSSVSSAVAVPSQFLGDCVKGVTSTSQGIDPSSARSTIGTITFKVLDHNEFISNFISVKIADDKGLRGKRVQYYWGTAGSYFHQYQLVRTFILDNYSYLDGEYTFETAEVIRTVQDSIMEPKSTTLTASITDTDLTIPVSASDGFFKALYHDNSYTDRPLQKVFYVMLEKELIACTAHTGGNLIVAANGRGALNTLAAAHNLKDTADQSKQTKIEEWIHIEGPAPKVALQILDGRVAENLVSYSEQFDQSNWNKTNCAVTANDETAPNGLISADKIVADGTSDPRITQSLTTSLANKTFNFSVWLWTDDGQPTEAQIKIYGATGNENIQTLDIVLTALPTRYDISTSFGGSPTSTALEFRIDLEESASNGEYLYAWGAQVVTTGYPGGYTKTEATNLPLETLPDHWHLAMAAQYLRRSDFLNLGKDLWNIANNDGKKVRFSGLKRISGKALLEKEFCLWMNCFFKIYNTGEMGIRRRITTLADASYQVILDENNITNYRALRHRLDLISNNLLVSWNQDHLTEDFTKKTLLVDTSSQVRWGETDQKVFEFRGVHTGAHTDENINEYLNGYRDSFSGPPLEIEVGLLPTLDTISLESGDIVHLNTSNIKDANSGTDITRAFEVRRVTVDWGNCTISVGLFGSSQKADSLTQITASSVMEDSWYSSEGTELSTVLTISAGEITANGSLDGADSLANAIYYYLGDLQLNSGVTISINKNVQLRVRGNFALNGKIDGKGAGYTGGVGDLGDVGDEPGRSGTPGYFGNTLHGEGMSYNSLFGLLPFGLVFQDGNLVREVLRGEVTAVPYLQLENRSGTEIAGVPNNLIGTSGSGGRALTSAQFPSFDADAGDGGSSGAGLLIISRGGGSGISGEIDTSGDDGDLGNFINDFLDENEDLYAGSGAGGAPGAVVWLIDGNHSSPNLASVHTANLGDCPLPPNPVLFSRGSTQIQSGKDYHSLWGYPLTSMSQSSSRVQYLPAASNASEEFDPLVSDVENFQVFQVGDSVTFSWDGVKDANRNAYIIKYGPVGTPFDSMQLVSEETRGTKITNKVLPPGTWDVGIVAVNFDYEQSPNPNIVTVVVVSEYDVIDQIFHHETIWNGCTLTNFGIYHTGILYPKSDDTASDYGMEMFESFVPNPFSVYSVETPEQDQLVDAISRLWGTYQGSLGPGETDVIALELMVDYHLDSGSYDGFETAFVGEVECRVVKFKLVMDPTRGLGYIQELLTTLDAQEVFDKQVGVSVSPGGTVINFNRIFRLPPDVSGYVVQGSTPLIPVFANFTTTTVEAHLYNLAGSDVGGTFSKLRFSGV